MDISSIIASILHDVVEDTEITLEEIKKIFVFIRYIPNLSAIGANKSRVSKAFSTRFSSLFLYCKVRILCEDTEITLEEIKKIFGSDVAMLVDGVTKLKGLNFVNKEEKSSNIFNIFIVL